MRILVAVSLLVVFVLRLEACSCSTPGTPCSAAALSAAVFTGTVLDITFHPRLPLPAQNTGPGSTGRLASRPSVDRPPNLQRPLRTIRIQLAEVLTGVEAWQKEVEVVTGLG